MVLTDLPFHRTPAVHTRYLYVQRPGSALQDDEIDEEEKYQLTQDYAAFLRSRDQEKKASKEVPVESHGVIQVYQGKPRSEPPRRSDVPIIKPLTAVDLAHKSEKEKKEYERRLHAIEDHMWQHKQDEKDLKRAEGEIIRGQREVKKSLRDFEHAITRKKMSEEKKLSQGLQRYQRVQQEHLHKREEETRARINELQQSSKEAKDSDRKAMLKANELAHVYKVKMSEMELKRIEMMRLSQAYEAQLRAKEEEQFKLKKELAELSISLNMEAAKTRKQKDEAARKAKEDRRKRLEAIQESNMKVDSQVTHGNDKEGKLAQMNRRKLSMDLALTKAHMSIKQRDEGRNLLEARNHMQSNSLQQRMLNHAAQQAKMEVQAKELDHKMHSVESRKTHQMAQAMRTRRESQTEHESHFSDKFRKRFHDQQRKEHEDHLRHFQKTVNKGENQEQQLFQKVKEAEAERLKREEQVRKIQRKIAETKRRHQLEIKQQLISVNQKEKELNHKLQRQQAQLAKVHSERDESYQALVKHRVSMKEYQHHLKEHEREHDRLLRVGEKSDVLRATST